MDYSISDNYNFFHKFNSMVLTKKMILYKKIFYYAY